MRGETKGGKGTHIESLSTGLLTQLPFPAGVAGGIEDMARLGNSRRCAQRPGEFCDGSGDSRHDDCCCCVWLMSLVELSRCVYEGFPDSDSCVECFTE